MHAPYRSIAGTFAAYAVLACASTPAAAQQRLIRSYRPPLPAVTANVEYEDLDGDGDPDVLRTTDPDGTPLQWIDDDDDMTATDRTGDTDSDCLMVDRNRDGHYGGFGDLMVDWNDEDGDQQADLQVVAENAWPRDTAWGPGHYMIVVDTDGDQVFNYVDWRDYQLKCWEHSGASHFFEDYLGQSLFLKMHTATPNIRDLRFNWENPFLFYDPDHDGVSERAIRLLDTPTIHAPPAEHYNLPESGDALTDAGRRVDFTGKIDWVSIAQDLDNDAVAGNEFDFDMTLHFEGPGFDYRDQVHAFKSLRGLPAADRFFYDPRWRQITELVYPDHDAAWDLIFQRGEWSECWLVFDEDDDCQRWERVELYYPRDPFKIGVRQGGIDEHNQADCSGDRGEWDTDNSGKGQLYVARFDGRIHLHGAEWGAWRIDQDAHYFQGWHRSHQQPDRFPTIKYTDTDDNGFFDRIAYDLDGDQSFERIVSLPALGLDDRAELANPAGMTYADFQHLHRTATEQLWQRAQAGVAAARANGLDMAPYAAMLHPASLREKYHYGYWLNHYVFADLTHLAEQRGDAAFMDEVARAYFGGDWSVLKRQIAPAQAKVAPSFDVEVSNPLDLARRHETVEIPWEAVQQSLPDAAADLVRVIDGRTGREIVSQVIDTDGDDAPDALLFQAHFDAEQMRRFAIQAAPPISHRHRPSPVHAKFVPTRMDDLAWESDRIAYRVYGPALRVETVSNGIDVWCKRVRYPIVEKWYQPEVNYHADHGEGADFFKVGPTLGCGGSAIWRDGRLYRGENFARWRILANGPVRTLFELEYAPIDAGGRLVRETKRFSLDAGHNLTRLETVYRCDAEGQPLEFAAGLVQRPGVEAHSGDGAPWISLWGPLEAEGAGQLGTGVVMPADVFQSAKTVDDHFVAIGRARPGEPVVYWAGAGWSRSGDFPNAEAWNAYLADWARRVNHPLHVSLPCKTEDEASAAPHGVRQVPVAEGWARNAVNAVIFRRHALTSRGDTQYIAFYDGQGRMVLGNRQLDGQDWTLHTTKYRGNVRDAHNTICIAVDGAGFLHVAWDHHNNPLNYARSVRPGALALTDLQQMTGRHENSVTYPEFYNLPDGGLLCMYRAGGSGRGNTMINRYDVTAQTWTPVQHPLIDGEGERNAYTNQLAMDADGAWHLSWCWRETGDVATNHDVCYARSADEGRTWSRADGTPYELPITAATAEVAWPVPQKHELINQCATAVDAQGHPLIAAYWRPEEMRVPQYHLVWHDGSAWHADQVGHRQTPFSLSGGGTKRIPISRPQLAVDGRGAAYMLFRDAERGSRVSLAIADDPQQRGAWRVVDLTDTSVGQWEPTYDVALWRARGVLHVFAQRVGQGDAETLEDVAPQMISVLEWRPQPLADRG